MTPSKEVHRLDPSITLLDFCTIDIDLLDEVWGKSLFFFQLFSALEKHRLKSFALFDTLSNTRYY